MPVKNLIAVFFPVTIADNRFEGRPIDRNADARIAFPALYPSRVVSGECSTLVCNQLAALPGIVFQTCVIRIPA